MTESVQIRVGFEMLTKYSPIIFANFDEYFVNLRKNDNSYQYIQVYQVPPERLMHENCEKNPILMCFIRKGKVPGSITIGTPFLSNSVT